ncbi:MAG: diguanylate cyclase [Armatimonadetes bacterium]|nr:diguanylate cyclase [Armatimonadota bacterium]
MRALPLTAQIYLTLVYLAGLLAVAGACVVPLPHSPARPWELGLFLVLALVAGGRKIVLNSHKRADDTSMSLGFAITFAAMLRFGPAAGLLVSAASSLSSCLYPKTQPPYQLLFNVSLSAVEAWLGGWVFLKLNGGVLDLRPMPTFPAVVVSSLTFYLLNTGCIAMVIALCTGQNAARLWRETFLWTASSYFAGASVSILALILFRGSAGWSVLPLLFIAWWIGQAYTTHTQRAAEQQRHIDELQKNQEHLQEVYRTTIRSLALAIDAKDQYTHQHILRVQRYAMATAKHMGLTGNELQGLETGALLHDIGKLGIPEHILLKPGRLTDEEFAKIKEHPTMGAAILDPVDFPWPVLPVVKYHHEKWDGTGYPSGLKGEEIPLTARILAVADVYDALTSARPYRKAWSHEKALSVITKDAGTHFDPTIVEAFLGVIDGVVAEMDEGAQDWHAVHSVAGPPITRKSGQAVRDIQRASSELWTLYEVAQTLSSSLGLSETLDILARKLGAVLPGTACLFLLRDEEGDGMSVRAAVGVNHEFFQGARTLGLGSLSLAVAAGRQTYVGEYEADDLMLVSSAEAQWTPLHGAIIVPIVHQGEVLGTINLYHPEAGALGVHDRQLLETIAERAGMALYNGLLFDRARSQALTDPLTGLYNLRYLTSVVEEHCARALTESADDGHLPHPIAYQFALLCLDLDSFKPINDNFGHHKGDQVLCDLARIFRANVREADVVARYGGDEFLVVLKGAGPEEAAAMAGRIQQAVEGYDPGLVHEKLGALRLGVSIGCACFPHDGRDCASLLSAADSQMYHDKTEHKLGRLVDKTRSAPAEDPPLSLAV